MELLRNIDNGIPFLINMPNWLRWWLYVAFAVGVGFAIVFFFWYITNSYRKAAYLEKRKVEKTKAAIARCEEDFNLEFKLLEKQFDVESRELLDDLGKSNRLYSSHEIKKRTALALEYKVKLIKLRKESVRKVEDIVYESYGKRDINSINDLEQEAQSYNATFYDRTEILIEHIEKYAIDAAKIAPRHDDVKQMLVVE